MNSDNKILIFDQEGRLKGHFGGEEYFERAVFIAFSEGSKRFYVTDARGHKLVAFDEKGTYLFSFGEAGSSDGQLASPQGLYITEAGHIYVADMLNSRVQVFDLKYSCAGFVIDVGEQHTNLASGHHLHELIVADIGRIDGRDLLAVAQDRDTVAHLPDLGQTLYCLL